MTVPFSDSSLQEQLRQIQEDVRLAAENLAQGAMAAGTDLLMVQMSRLESVTRKLLNSLAEQRARMTPSDIEVVVGQILDHVKPGMGAKTESLRSGIRQTIEDLFRTKGDKR